MNKAAIIWFPILLVLMCPYSFYNLFQGPFKYFLHIMIIIISLASIVLYVRHARLNAFIICLSLYCVSMIVSTILNNGNVMSVLLVLPDFPIIKILGMCALVTFWMSKKPITCCNILCPYFICILIINLFTILLFPGGIYITGQDENYFLGFDNTHCVVYYLAITVGFLRDRIRAGDSNRIKISRQTVVIISIVHICTLICKSGTSLIQLAMFDFLVVFSYRSRKVFRLNFKKAIIVNLLFSFFLIFEFAKRGNRWISFIAVNVLHKDPTFTSRIYIWEKAKYYIARNIWIGYGWDIDAARARLLTAHEHYHAHNQYLTDLFYGGIPMLLLLLLLVFLLAFKLDSYRNDPAYYLLLSVFFVSLFHWNTESMHMPMQLVTFAIIYNIDKIGGIKKKYPIYYSI